MTAGQGGDAVRPGMDFATNLRAGSVLAGYRLTEPIGQGGMAVVFLAADQHLGRRVALKVMSAALAADAGFRGRFVRESRAAAAVDDPHILPVYEAGEAAGVLYIAMRYVPGGDVRTALSAQGRFPPARTAAIISQVASALDAAHGAGLVHRDVKPANMLLDVRPGQPDHVYLSDFGLSKSWQGTTGLTGTGLFLGTLDYAAPEQIEGRAVDGRADQYALACSAFELMAGEPPFRRDDGLAVMYAQLSQPPPRLAGRLPELTPAVDMVLARGMAKAPGERFASCSEFATALRSALGLPGTDPPGQQPPPPFRPATVLASAEQPQQGNWTPQLAGAGTQGPIPVPGMATPAYGVPPPWPGGTTAPPPAPPGRARRGILAAVVAVAVVVIGGGAAVLALSHKPHPSAASHVGRSGHTTPPAGRTTPATALGQVKVCTYPAITCSGYHGAAEMKVQPTQIVNSADGSGYVKNLTWSGWGSATARGSGILEIDNCEPDCASGTYSGYPATVTLSGIASYGNGSHGYSVMVIDAPTSPAPEDSFTTGLLP